MLQVSNTTLCAKLNPASPYFDAAMPQPLHFNGGRTPYWLLTDIEEYIAAAVKAKRAPPFERDPKEQAAASTAANGSKVAMNDRVLEPKPQGQQRARAIPIVVRKRRTHYVKLDPVSKAPVSAQPGSPVRHHDTSSATTSE